MYVAMGACMHAWPWVNPFCSNVPNHMHTQMCSSDAAQPSVYDDVKADPHTQDNLAYGHVQQSTPHTQGSIALWTHAIQLVL